MTDAAGIPTKLDIKNAEPVLIIGAGVAGLAAAAGLGQLGVLAEVLECGEGVASSWKERYDRMRMNTCRWNMSLWFGRFPSGTPTFPTRDEFVRYMESHASKHDLQVSFGVKVHRIDRVADGWRLATSAEERTARKVIVATGHERIARIPDWPGRNRFPGRLLHSAEYRNPREFRGSDVLVVGSDLAPWGLTLPEEGTFSALRRDDSQPTIIDPDVVEAIKGGRIEIVAGVSSVDADGVRLNDGTMLWPDTIIAATGFSTGLEPLVGHLGVLDDEGMPRGGHESAIAPGLHFLGYESGVGIIGPRARRATRDLCRELAGAR